MMIFIIRNTIIDAAMFSLIADAGTAVPRDGVSLTATGLALALMVISIYILRGTLHGIHAWLVSCTGNTCIDSHQHLYLA